MKTEISTKNGTITGRKIFIKFNRPRKALIQVRFRISYFTGSDFNPSGRTKEITKDAIQSTLHFLN